MNPQLIYHAYAMTYVELDAARADGRPVPASIVARLASGDAAVLRAAMRAIKDVERSHPRRSKHELLQTFGLPRSKIVAV